MAQSVQRLATGWTVRGSNPGGARLSASVQTGPGAHPASCTMGTGSLPGVMRPGRGADHPPPPKRRGHERVGLYFYSPSGPQWPVIGRNLLLLVHCRVAIICITPQYLRIHGADVKNMWRLASTPHNTFKARRFD